VAEFTTVAQVGDVPVGEMFLTDLDGDEVVLANVEGEIYAFSGICTHHWARLDLGDLDGDLVSCPFHGGQFCVRTGEAVTPPAALPLPIYKVQIDGDDIKVAPSD
jgi:3-phenylpropionate/trans-cinnamate dioxygenase ferredoxin component